MLKCKECGHLFEEGEQARWTEDYGECHGYPVSEKMSGCPLCHGDYDYAKKCKICGSYELEEDEEYCKECKADVQKRFINFVNTEFSPEERELLNFLYDGEEI